jgi:hypothetical protein
MRRVILVLLLSSGCLMAQATSGAANQSNSKDSKGQITVQGCVDRRSGDYVLIQQDPGMTYELQGTDKVKVSKYFGQRVQVTGTKLESLPTSSDSLATGGAPSPLTIRVTSIKTLDKNCSTHEVSK